MIWTKEQAKQLAIEAAARGWISAEQLWETADLCSRHDSSDEEASGRLRSLLAEERLSTLEREVRDYTPVHVDSSIPPPRFSRKDIITVPGGPPSRRDPGGMPGLASEARYRVEKVLGRGGVGQVVAVRDREIGRAVARKTLRDGALADDALVRKFLIEARVTAQLEHPNIIPIYDLGVSVDGTPFYTMRVVEKHSLANVLGSELLMADWPLARMLGALSQVCRALAYAHSKGVLHGDIKPENVLLGDFGEVYLADWGLTRVQPHSPVRTSRSTSAPPAPHSLLSLAPGEVPDATPRSRPGGTPGYAPPEVIHGNWSLIDHRADLFSLGVVLYEILTGRRPFEGKTPREVIFKTLQGEPQPPRQVSAGCPLLLEDLCLELLHKDRAQRPDSAAVVASRIEDYLEGAKEKERRRLEATRLCDAAVTPVAEHLAQQAEAERMRSEAALAAKEIEDWQSIEVKRRVWTIEDAASAAERESARRLAEAIELYTKALGYDAEHLRAHEGLADLYWSRAQAAERERRRPTQIYYEAMVAEHDTGRYAELMSASAELRVSSTPPGATVVLRRYELVDRQLVAGGARVIGTTPLDAVELAPGSFLLELSLEGYRTARYPSLLRRGQRHHAQVSLYTEEEIGEGLIYVPGGRAILGGDLAAVDPLSLREVDVGDFAIAEYPVTMRDYCAFLDDLEVHDPAEAARRAPCNLRDTAAAAVKKGDDGRWCPDDLIIEGEARALFPAEQGHLWRVPAHLVTWFDARAYCLWLSARDGVDIRLPSEVEWEKAARGGDGRFFPWGDHFDATFCHMRDSRPFVQQPEPVGTFPTDLSPYGVRDLAGGMREWVADICEQRSAAELWAEAEPAEGVERAEAGFRIVRSGAWNVPRDRARSASRGLTYALLRGTGTTFRVAKSLARKP